MRPATRLALIHVTMLAASGHAAAQTARGAGGDYPAKPIRMVVGYPAGGPTDLLARTVAQKLSESWNQQVIVDNRGGASGMIGAELVVRAAPDGYTLLMVPVTYAVTPRPIRIVVPYPAGGPVDITARAIGPKLSAAAPHQGRPAARAGGHQRKALGLAARAANHERSRPRRVRIGTLARLVRAGAHCAGDRRPPLPRSRGDTAQSGNQFVCCKAAPSRSACRPRNSR